MPICFDAAFLSWRRRARLCWHNSSALSASLAPWVTSRSYFKHLQLPDSLIHLSPLGRIFTGPHQPTFLQEAATGSFKQGRFCTLTRPVCPRKPSGWADASQEARQRQSQHTWYGCQHYERAQLLFTAAGEWRTPNADENEKMLGFLPGYTAVGGPQGPGETSVTAPWRHFSCWQHPLAPCVPSPPSLVGAWACRPTRAAHQPTCPGLPEFAAALRCGSSCTILMAVCR